MQSIKVLMLLLLSFFFIGGNLSAQVGNKSKNKTAAKSAVKTASAKIKQY